MRLFDSHCHLDDRAFDRDLDDVIHRMHDADVVSAMTIGTTFERCVKGVAILRERSWPTSGTATMSRTR